MMTTNIIIYFNFEECIDGIGYCRYQYNYTTHKGGWQVYNDQSGNYDNLSRYRATVPDKLLLLWPEIETQLNKLRVILEVGSISEYNKQEIES